LIYFAVVAGVPGQVERLAPCLLGALERTRLVNGARIERTGARRTWALAVIEEPDATCSSRVACDGDAFVVFNGPAFAADGDQHALAENLLKRYRDRGSREVTDHLDGTYNFVGVAPDVGLSAFGDFSGTYPLYWHAGEGFTVLSNRSLTVSDLVGSRQWNPRALAWVIARANLTGDDLPLRHVRHLPPGVEARAAWGTGALEFDSSTGSIWPTASDDPGRDNLTPGEWDEITDALVGNVRAFASVDAPLRLGLTGGKDSRLCLALVKAAGLRDRVDVFTSGGPESPEVQVARAVAQAAGFAHGTPGSAGMTAQPAPDVATPTKAAPPNVDIETVWRRLRRNITRYEAIVPAWTALQNPTHRPFVTIKGFGGEFFRRGTSQQSQSKVVRSVDELAVQFAAEHRKMDRLGIIRTAEAEYQTQWIESWVHATAQRMRSDVALERFHLEADFEHWFGPLLQCAPQSVTLNPLVSRMAAQKNLELSAAARSSERFHFEVTRRAAAELVVIPFLNDRWAPELAAGSSLDLPQHPFPTAVKPTGRAIHPGNPGWQFLETERKTFDHLFKEADKHTEMGSVCDMKKLRRVARSSRPMTRFGEIREMIGAVGVALTLLDRAEPVILL
jgi:hypothetical protein